MKLAWLTDIHLNFLSKVGAEEFAKSLAMSFADAVVITGDISEGDVITAVDDSGCPIDMDCYNTKESLLILEKYLQRPIYYVHGNHDYYGLYFEQLKDIGVKLSNESKYLKWMQHCEIIELTPKTCITGHDGWYDARNGTYFYYEFNMPDFYRIKDFVSLNRNDRYYAFNELGDFAAQHAKRVLTDAFKKYDNVIFITHVPPFTQAARYQGGPTQEYALPFFTCWAMEKAILDVMEVQPPEKKLTVLAGHTHFAGELKIEHFNIAVEVAPAMYGKPCIYTYINVE